MRNEEYSKDDDDERSGDDIESVLEWYREMTNGDENAINDIDEFLRHGLLKTTHRLANDEEFKFGRLYVRGASLIQDDVRLFVYWQRFAAALEHYSRDIRHFRLERVRVSALTLKLLTSALTGKNLQELKLIDLEGEGVLFAEAVVRRCPSLWGLEISDKIVDLEAVSCLSDSLREHRNLRVLRLHGCGLGEHVAVLSALLHAAKNIKHVFLHDNEINSLGCDVIADVIAINPLMERLSLAFNQLSDDDAASLAQALRTNTHLSTLDLQGNDCLTSYGIDTLCCAVFDNSTLNAAAGSNHTCALKLSGVGVRSAALQMNKYYPAQVNRMNKIFFALHDDKRKGLHLHHFNDLQLGIIPRVFELLQNETQKTRSFSDIFELLRWKMPILFLH